MFLLHITIWSSISCICDIEMNRYNNKHFFSSLKCDHKLTTWHVYACLILMLNIKNSLLLTNSFFVWRTLSIIIFATYFQRNNNIVVSNKMFSYSAPFLRIHITYKYMYLYMFHLHEMIRQFHSVSLYSIHFIWMTFEISSKYHILKYFA